jgi:hypothetical protein
MGDFLSDSLNFSRSIDFACGQLPFCYVEDNVAGLGGVSCYYSFRVQRYVRCMIHVRYEYSFSQAVLDERRSGCAPNFMYDYRA